MGKIYGYGYGISQPAWRQQMNMTEQQKDYIAGLREMTDYLEKHPKLIPAYKPYAMLMPWSLQDTVALLKEMGEPLVEASGDVTCDHGSFSVKLYLPSIAKVTVRHAGVVDEVAAVLDAAAQATAEHLAAEKVTA